MDARGFVIEGNVDWREQQLDSGVGIVLVEFEPQIVQFHQGTPFVQREIRRKR